MHTYKDLVCVFSAVCFEKEDELESCVEERKKKSGEDGWGRWMRNKIWRGGWYLGWDLSLALSLIFLFSLIPGISLSSSTLLFPLGRLLRVFGGPAQPALQEALSRAPLSTGGTGPSCHALPPGQWVCSGRADSSEWASLQFHYSRNWLKWKLYLTSRRAFATTWKPKGETETRREGEMNLDGKREGRLFRRDIWRDQLWERLSVFHVWRNSQG